MKYVDADIFVYWATDHAKHGERATQIIRHIELNEKAVTSALTFWLFNNLMREQPGYRLRSFLDQIQRLRNLRIVPLDDDVLAEADDYAQEKKVSTAVAVAAVTARNRGADSVYSTNPEFDRTQLKRVF